MIRGYLVVGLSHKTAPVELRERCRVEDPARALRELRELAAEAALLSTCNRFEIYVHGGAEAARIADWIAGLAPDAGDELASHCYFRRGRNACKHLFFVASSLDSLVVGETQIRAQVKEAYRVATQHGGVGPHLHRLFQEALRVSKEISDRTGVGRGNVSVAGAAADLAERVFGDLGGGTVLVVGAGETAELVMFHLQSRGVTRFQVVNRTLETARELAARFDADAGPLASLDERLEHADVLVAAAGANEPLVRADAMRRAIRRRRGRPIVAIDIAVPRGVDPEVGRLDNVYRYDMDTLSSVTRDALRHRRREFLQCCTMIDAAALRMEAEARAYEAGGAISELRRGYEEIARAELEELERRLPGLGPEEREKVRRTVNRIIGKLLHRPVRALRELGPEKGELIRKAFSADVERKRRR